MYVQVWQAVRYDISLHMGFSEKESMRFVRAVESLKVDLDVAMPQMIDVHGAQATVQSDLVMIKEAIRVSIGMDSLNYILRQKLMAHLVRTYVNKKSSLAKRRRRYLSLVQSGEELAPMSPMSSGTYPLPLSP